MPLRAVTSLVESWISSLPPPLGSKATHYYEHMPSLMLFPSYRISVALADYYPRHRISVSASLKAPRITVSA
jgi:hypothetical protein